eukprot:scaffold253044_cov28-Prasinocladus_malaysianus.AAC.1
MRNKRHRSPCVVVGCCEHLRLSAKARGFTRILLGPDLPQAVSRACWSACVLRALGFAALRVPSQINFRTTSLSSNRSISSNMIFKQDTASHAVKRNIEIVFSVDDP